MLKVRNVGETYLFSEIRLFSRSKRRQLRGRAKFYAVDPLIAKQAGYHHTESTYWILENHVCNELLRRGYELFYWHSKQGYEVDFIARDASGRLSAVQVAVSLDRADTLSRELRGLEAAKRELGINALLIVTKEEVRPDTEIPDSVQVLPFFRWALNPIAR